MATMEGGQQKSDLPDSVLEIVMGFNFVTSKKSFQNSQMSTCVLCSCLLRSMGSFSTKKGNFLTYHMDLN